MNTTLRLAALALILPVACSGKEDDSATPTGSAPTGTTPTTGTVDGPNVELIEGTQVTCAFPSARANGYFERKTLAHDPADGSHTWGGGVISADLDTDGTLDLVVATQAGLQLWLTRTGATPNDASLEAYDGGLTGIALDYAVGGTAVDIDADGDQDLIISRWERPNRLLINQGDHFTDGTPGPWNSRSYKTQSASVGDMDGDGDLDVFFGSYGEPPAVADPVSLPPADPAELYRNEGGSWTDASGSLPTEANRGYTLASGWWNVWGDTAMELVIANDFGSVYPSVVLRAAAGNGWEVDRQFHPGQDDRGMGVGDANGDSVPDFLFSGYKALSVLASGVNYGNPGVYLETATSWAVQPDVEASRQVYGWGSEWGDLDNDSDLDSMVIYGHWAAFADAGDPLAQTDALYEQTGLLQFTQRAAAPEWQVNDTTRGRGLVFADLNDDGYLDVIKGHPETDTLVYQSRCGSQNWIRVRLQQDGPNRDAIGARIEATTGGYTQTRWIQAGSSGLYGGTPLEAHFGLGGALQVDRMQVFWPDGKVATFEPVNGNRRVTVLRHNGP